MMLVFLAVLTVQTLYSQRTVTMSLRNMVEAAGSIVHGTVASTRSGKDPATGMICTWVTIKVKENVYGAKGATHTFKVVGGESEGLVYRPVDVPRFSVNEEVVLLLYREHRVSGFTSPVGMGQGKFNVRTSTTGKTVERLADASLLKRSGPMAAELNLSTLLEDLRRIVPEVKGGAR
jgi:hypothetical protein